MISTIRTTVGRENAVIETLTNKIKNMNLAIKSIFHPGELKGYIFLEGNEEAIIPNGVSWPSSNGNATFSTILLNTSGGSGEIAFRRHAHADAAGTASQPHSLGVLSLTKETAGGDKWASLKLGTLALQSIATPVITSVTPSANNGVTCTYVLVAREADNTATTQGSAAVSTGAAGPTNCNSNTVVWTAAAGVAYYQLNRTVGGATQGMITAMNAWLNVTTNCPAGTCTYVDTGTAAAGGVPVANTTGQIVSRSYNTETACASSAGACGTSSAGHFSMDAASTTATVTTTAVNANSQIFIQENSTLGALLGVTCNATVVRTYAVSTVTAGVSFIVTASVAPAVNPACLSYRILN